MSENETKYAGGSGHGADVDFCKRVDSVLGGSQASIIKPTIGRQVWFWRKGSDPKVHQAEAATVVFVHGDSMVTLQVLDHMGVARSEFEVSLRQPPDPVWETTPFAEWMPFQKGQAAKTEQLAEKLGKQDER
jgi:hypothetical protein